MTKNIKNINYLIKEFEEINHYLRAVFIIGITWYAFFMTANFYVLGWFSSRIMAEEYIIYTKYYFAVLIFFIYLNVIALIICTFSIAYFSGSNKRLIKIIELINESESDNKMNQPFRIKLVVFIISIIISTLMFLLYFWTNLLIEVL